LDDKQLRTIAAFEQVGAFLNVFATFLYSYHKDLVNAGFQRNEALKLVEQLQSIMFKQSFNLGTDKDDLENFEDDEEI
jgi:hypothetical protein